MKDYQALAEDYEARIRQMGQRIELLDGERTRMIETAGRREDRIGRLEAQLAGAVERIEIMSEAIDAALEHLDRATPDGGRTRRLCEYLSTVGGR